MYVYVNAFSWKWKKVTETYKLKTKMTGNEKYTMKRRMHTLQLLASACDMHRKNMFVCMRL